MTEKIFKGIRDFFLGEYETIYYAIISIVMFAVLMLFYCCTSDDLMYDIDLMESTIDSRRSVVSNDTVIPSAHSSIRIYSDIEGYTVENLIMHIGSRSIYYDYISSSSEEPTVFTTDTLGIDSIMVDLDLVCADGTVKKIHGCTINTDCIGYMKDVYLIVLDEKSLNLVPIHFDARVSDWKHVVR